MCKWGPSVRNIVRSMDCARTKTDDTIKDEVQAAVDLACKEGLNIVTGSAMQHMPISDASSLIFLKRVPRKGELSRGQVFIPTEHLIEIFEEHRCKLEIEKSLDLFCLLSSHSVTRTAAGWIHEKCMHKRLSTGGADLLIFQGSTQKSIRPSTLLLPGTLAGLGQADISKSFYWMPSVSNFPGIDSVLGNKDGQIYTLQATIARNHKSPIDGIVKVWEQFPSAVQRQCTWHFVAVTNTEQAAKSYMKKYSQRLASFELGGRPVQVWSCVL